jgi:hypothetical protein
MTVFIIKVVVGLFLVILALGIYQAVRIGAMSDSDRESYGHGPKGQGR